MVQVRAMRPNSREQVLQLLMVESAGLRAPELLRQLKPPVSQPTLWRVLNGLRAESRIIAEGRGRATRYHASSRTDLAALRSLRLHQCVARRLAADPTLRGLARTRLQKLRQVNPHGRTYHDAWEALLDGPLTPLLRTLTEESERADSLRQDSPFSILVTAQERRRIFEATKAA